MEVMASGLSHVFNLFEVMQGHAPVNYIAAIDCLVLGEFHVDHKTVTILS